MMVNPPWGVVRSFSFRGSQREILKLKKYATEDKPKHQKQEKTLKCMPFYPEMLFKMQKHFHFHGTSRWVLIFFM